MNRAEVLQQLMLADNEAIGPPGLAEAGFVKPGVGRKCGHSIGTVSRRVVQGGDVWGAQTRLLTYTVCMHGT